MKKFRVVGQPYQAGPGQEVEISREQFEARKHRVTVVRETKDRVVVTATEPISFKAGEEIGLEEADKAFADRLEAVKAGKAEDGDKDDAPAKTADKPKK